MRSNIARSGVIPKVLLFAASVLLGGLLAACATSGYEPVTDPGARVEGHGFAILPPTGAGWYLRWMAVGDSRVPTFNRQGSPGSATHTVVAIARGSSLQDPGAVGFPEYANDIEVFAAFVKKSTEVRNPPGGRMRALEHTVTHELRRGHCVREHAKWEDHGAMVRGGALIQQDWELLCLHPDSTQVVIDVGVSERGLPGEADPSLEAVREAYFDSLQFRPLK